MRSCAWSRRSRIASERPGAATVVVPAVAASCLAVWLDGPVLWAVALALAVASAATAAGYLARFEPLGVPIESTLVTGVAAVAGLGLVHLIGPTPSALGVVAIAAFVVGLALAAERSWLVAAVRRREPSPVARPEVRVSADWRLLSAIVLIGFVAFAGVIGLADRALVPRLLEAGGPGRSGSGQFAVIIAGSGLVAAALGYRIAAIDGSGLVDALWTALGYGVLGAAAVTALQTAGIAVVGWPGVLTAVLYLWGAAHRLLAPLGRTVTRLLEALLLAGGSVAVAVLHLQPR